MQLKKYSIHTNVWHSFDLNASIFFVANNHQFKAPTLSKPHFVYTFLQGFVDNKLPLTTQQAIRWWDRKSSNRHIQKCIKYVPQYRFSLFYSWHHAIKPLSVISRSNFLEYFFLLFIDKMNIQRISKKQRDFTVWSKTEKTARICGEV